ncbi:MAG: type IV toxin-antitoxin system AbiEi family antitoxin [Lentisphaeraceae bacterium]|nr:type IV toxin-antitoxin system AbiEi family antitoxin [Lentisphaeraceae bacterium]
MKNIKKYKDFLHNEGLKLSVTNDVFKLIKGHNSKKYKLFLFSKISSTELNVLMLENSETFVFTDSVVDFETVQLLKKLNVNFVDSSGNMLVTFDGVHISIFHKAPKQKSGFKGPSPLKSAGIKFAFQILKEGQSFLDEFVTECAKTADISVGAVSNLKKVFEEHYINDDGELKKDSLINDFSISYNNLFKPKHAIGEYYCEDLSGLLDDDRVIISGQHAVKSHFKNVSVIPRFGHVYIKREDAGKVILKYKLKKDVKNCNIMIIDLPFNLSTKYAPLLLAYADLLDSDDPRDKELALEVFNELQSQ